MDVLNNPYEKIVKMLTSPDKEMVNLGKSLVSTLTSLSFSEKIELCLLCEDIHTFLRIINSIKKTRYNYISIYNIIIKYYSDRRSFCSRMARITILKFSTNKSKGLFNICDNECIHFSEYINTWKIYPYFHVRDSSSCNNFHPVEVMSFVVNIKIPKTIKERNNKDEKSNNFRRRNYKSC